MNARFFIILIALLGAASADVILPDQHSVEHRLYIDNLGDYGEYEFFIFPTYMTENVTDGSKFMASSEVPGAYKFASPHLFAVKKTDMKNKSIEEYFENALKSDVSLVRVNTLPNSDPRYNIETHYNVSISGGKLTLTKTLEKDDGRADDECPGAETDFVFPALALGVGLLAGYLVGKKA